MSKLIYRKKLILSIFEEVEELSDSKLQYLMFLICQNQNEKSYYFVPHSLGVKSNQLSFDLQSLIKKNLITKVNYTCKLSGNLTYIHQLKDIDKAIIYSTKDIFYLLNENEILNHIYNNHPNYNNIINNLSNNKLENHNKILFSIGYEGINIDNYINKLILNKIKLIVDVRANPNSRKIEFSKNILKQFLEENDINYLNIPDLGINSKKRKNINSESDYKKLFIDYEHNLKNMTNLLNDLVELIDKYNRIALTCYEKDAHNCHRNIICNLLTSRKTWKYKIIHI